jgi:serine/threonine-protein kinase RIO1
MIGQLYYKLDLVYVDLTSYNVMKDGAGVLWLIDFGHAKYHEDAKDTEHKYVLAFIDGEEGWNEDYR